MKRGQALLGNNYTIFNSLDCPTQKIARTVFLEKLGIPIITKLYGKNKGTDFDTDAYNIKWSVNRLTNEVLVIWDKKNERNNPN